MQTKQFLHAKSERAVLILAIYLSIGIILWKYFQRQSLINRFVPGANKTLSHFTLQNRPFYMCLDLVVLSDSRFNYLLQMIVSPLLPGWKQKGAGAAAGRPREKWRHIMELPSPSSRRQLRPTQQLGWFSVSRVRWRDGVVHEQWMWLQDCFQAETNERSISSDRCAHTSPAASDRQVQKADTHVQTEWLRFRGRPGNLPESTLGSDRCGAPPWFGRAACRAFVNLVPPVWWHRLQHPKGERSAVSSLRKLGPATTSKFKRKWKP